MLTLKTCPKCGAEHSKPGVFCSRKCANSRFWSEEDKLNRRETALRYTRSQGIVPVSERPQKPKRVKAEPRDMAQYMHKRRTERNAWALDYLGGKCAWCGSIERLQYDHIDRKTKSFAISPRGLDVGFARFKVEIDKCQLLCFPCHVEKSRREQAETMKELWKDPSYRQNRSSTKGIPKGPQTEEHRRHISEGVKLAIANNLNSAAW